jgi:hypothetical protein
VRDEAELRRQHDLVATSRQRAADELLVGVGAVDLGGVDEGDAQLERSLEETLKLLGSWAATADAESASATDVS